MLLTCDVVGVVEAVAVERAGLRLFCGGAHLLCSGLAEQVSAPSAAAAHMTWLRRRTIS